MEHRFSKHEYFISFCFAIVFSGLVGASYLDVSTCPYRYNRGTPTELAAEGRSDSINNSCGRSVTAAHGSASPRSIFTSLKREGGIVCHMADLVIWVYIIALVLFMMHKYYLYRMQGLHYFLLDYCYFHNACLVVFLLWRLVDVQWSDEPLVSWETWLPQEWLSDRSIRSSIHGNNNSGISGNGSIRTIAMKTTPLVNQTWASWGKQLVPLTARQVMLVGGIYKPISIDIITIGYAAAEVSSADELLLNFLSFFTLVAGSFGPILGAILMWKNALLLHSFDRMSSCYLHLAPAVTQVLLLHRLFTSARQELASVDASQPDNSSSPQYQLAEVCGEGTLCNDLRHAVSYWTLLKLHFAMFIAWQIFYHTFSESRRRHREKSHRKKMKTIARQQEEFCRLTGATAEEAELLRPIIVLSEGSSGNPTQRVTAYTWLMEHPPLGKQGPLYRFVTMFGTAYLPTMVMFQVTQWLLHVVFFTLAYPVLYYSFHVELSAWPLVLYVIVFIFVCVYNAALMCKKWYQKLRDLAEIGLEVQRMRGTALAAGTASKIEAPVS
ncbi:hypothetical protein DQ04_07021010 [Trypanosoma grayi]|uniref:hypothetical protein n=1 Tax=Trypanosoma grayi TaxID=71804 RepID=UPI0004F46B5F|nr:hypothetical protein DQ04_07021010 [Trypanosoma grayi]KEG08506.1 hypothetical protein DQ04_07021010 [Trypanosoma grayi]